MSRSREARRVDKRLLTMALVAVLYSTGSACGGEASLSSDEIQRDAGVVLRADLKPGSTGETAARIVRAFARVEGVWGTRGDNGKHVWIYGTPDVTSGQVRSIQRKIEDAPSVTSVTQVR